MRLVILILAMWVIPAQAAMAGLCLYEKPVGAVTHVAMHVDADADASGADGVVDGDTGASTDGGHHCASCHFAGAMSCISVHVIVFSDDRRAAPLHAPPVLIPSRSQRIERVPLAAGLCH